MKRSITLEFDGDRLEVDLFPASETREFHHRGVWFRVELGTIFARSNLSKTQPRFRVIGMESPFGYAGNYFEVALGDGRWFMFDGRTNSMVAMD